MEKGVANYICNYLLVITNYMINNYNYAKMMARKAVEALQSLGKGGRRL